MIVLDDRLQHGIEAKVREPMAKWLNVNVPPGEPVVSESAGYVGFFGKVRLWDYPGLTSKQSMAFMRRLGWQRNNMFDLIDLGRPAFAVFRPNELEGFRGQFPRAAAQYKEAARFSVPFEQSRLEWGGVAMVNIDRDFVVVRRTR
jgi:hypothetical protein